MARNRESDHLTRRVRNYWESTYVKSNHDPKCEFDPKKTELRDRKQSEKRAA